MVHTKQPVIHAAYERWDVAQLPVVLLCEHASQSLPSPWAWSQADDWLAGTHWAIDIGAAALCRELVHELGCGALLARFSRLLIDANRPLDAQTLLRTVADGKEIALNRNISDAERTVRIAEYWTPYHQAAGALVASHPDAVVIGIHSFTPCYEGEHRTMEVGVLFDHDEDFGLWAYEQFQSMGFRVALNEPYSGRNGLMYSPQRHATEHNRKTVELEIRQDLLGDDLWRAHHLPKLAQFMAGAADWAAQQEATVP